MNVHGEATHKSENTPRSGSSDLLCVRRQEVHLVSGNPGIHGHPGQPGIPMPRATAPLASGTNTAPFVVGKPTKAVLVSQANCLVNWAFGNAANCTLDGHQEGGMWLSSKEAPSS